MLPVEAQAAFLRPDKSRVAEGGGHAVVLETARRIHAFVLEVQPIGFQTHVAADGGRNVQQRLALAHGDALLDGHEGQQVVEPPHAAETMRIAAPAPFVFKNLPGPRRGDARPVVGHVQQAAAAARRRRGPRPRRRLLRRRAKCSVEKRMWYEWEESFRVEQLSRKNNSHAAALHPGDPVAGQRVTRCADRPVSSGGIPVIPPAGEACFQHGTSQNAICYPSLTSFSGIYNDKSRMA